MRTFVLGDVHGMRKMLEALLDAIAEECGTEPRTIVLLGDYVDRGPDGRGVIDLLRQGPSSDGETWIPLRGNHDQLMIDSSRRDDDAAGTWIANGGWQTLSQYMTENGVDEEALRRDVDFLDTLPLLHVDRHRIFVHAGLRPGVPLDDQKPKDLLWIRDEFLHAVHDFGRLVVHGHTVTETGEIEILENRVGVDTGAFDGGRLTACGFDDDGRDVVCVLEAVEKPSGEIVVERRDIPRLEAPADPFRLVFRV